MGVRAPAFRPPLGSLELSRLGRLELLPQHLVLLNPAGAAFSPPPSSSCRHLLSASSSLLYFLHSSLPLFHSLYSILSHPFPLSSFFPPLPSIVLYFHPAFVIHLLFFSFIPHLRPTQPPLYSFLYNKLISSFRCLEFSLILLLSLTLFNL